MEMRKNIMVIPAVKKYGNTVSKEEVKKLRVAAYCRVSTDTDEQATSYDTQVAHYMNIPILTILETLRTARSISSLLSLRTSLNGVSFLSSSNLSLRDSPLA